jgi:hypothetical protein
MEPTKLYMDEVERIGDETAAMQKASEQEAGRQIVATFETGVRKRIYPPHLVLVNGIDTNGRSDALRTITRLAREK